MSYLAKRLISGLLVLAVAPAASGDAQEPLDCLLEPKVVVEISSPVPGVIADILVEKSDVVERGQPIARLESALQRARVRQARSRAEASADIEAANANLDFAKRNYDRLNGLFADGAVATHHLDEARTDLALARSQLKKAQENRASAGMDLQHALESLNQRTIRSPISGVVIARYRSPGEFVEAEPILQLATLDPLKVEVIAPAELFGTIRQDMRGTVIAESSSDAYEARVSLVDRVVDAASGTFGVRLELPNPDYRLPGGLKCKVEFSPPASAAGSDVAPGHTQPDAPAAVSAATDNIEAAAVCATVGPMSSVEQADLIATALAGYTTRVARREVTAAAPAGYLVLTSQLDSPQHALAVAAELRDNRVSDVAILVRGPNRDRVSLGYYHQEAPAVARRDALQALGVATAVVARTTDQQQVWLDVSFPVAERADIARAIQDTDPASSMEPVACPEMTISVAGT